MDFHELWASIRGHGLEFVVVVGALLILHEVFARCREWWLRRLAQDGCYRRGAPESEYFAQLQRESNRSVTERSMELVCLVDPFWFEKNARRRAILKIYENSDIPKGRKVRIVILSRRQIRRLHKRHGRHRARGGGDLLQPFAGVNTFECLWACKNEFERHYSTRDDILLEDYALFDRHYIIRYKFRGKVLIVGGNHAVLERARRVFDDRRQLRESLYFETFEGLYSAVNKNRKWWQGAAGGVKSWLGRMRRGK